MQLTVNALVLAVYTEDFCFFLLIFYVKFYLELTFSFMIAKQPKNVARFSTAFTLVGASKLSFYFELSYSKTLR